MTTEADDKIRRDRLRAVFSALRELAKSVPEDEGWNPMDTAVADATRDLGEAFDDMDVVGFCEGCSRPIVSGDMSHPTADGVTLCEEHAPSWADAKQQWEEGRDEEDEGDRASFMEAYDAHIKNGGKPEDLLLYVTE